MQRVPNDHPVELSAPDISIYREGNTGVPYFTSFDSGRAGPHVALTALVHGNELCGAIALDHLLRSEVRPLAGCLTLGFINTDAYEAFDPADPTTSRFVDEDFNRLWSPAILGGTRQSCELTRAREIWPLVDTVDHLLDIHSMQNRTPPLMMAGPLDKNLALARAIATPHFVVRDAGHAAGPRLRDYGGFAEAYSPRSALLVECGQHWESESAAVAIDAAYRFLLHFGLISKEMAEPHLRPLPATQAVIAVDRAVTVQTDAFEFAQDFRGLEVLAEGDPIGMDGDTPVTAPYDDCVLIMPSRRLWPGQTAVRLGRIERKVPTAVG